MVRVPQGSVSGVGFASRPSTPREVKLGRLLLSQSGQIAPTDASGRRIQLVPDRPTDFVEIVVTALSPSGIRSENRFPIDAQGYVETKLGKGLGMVPYLITLVAKDGSTYEGIV